MHIIQQSIHIAVHYCLHYSLPHRTVGYIVATGYRGGSEVYWTTSQSGGQAPYGALKVDAH